MNYSRSILTIAILCGLMGPAFAQLTPASLVNDRAAPRPEIDIPGEIAVLQSMSRVVKHVARVAKPSVVHLEARKTETKRGRSEEFDEAGSGAIVEIDGSFYVLTNRHVVFGAKESQVTVRLSDGRELHPIRIISDSSTDVAIMEVRGEDLEIAQLGDSDRVDIGDFVLAIGSPFGLSHSVTFGIISAKGRRDLTLGEERIELQDFFQTDAAINPGNSGGPLLNLQGEVIGLNTAIASSSGGSEGIGFAIPINMVMLVARQLATVGRLQRSYLGVSLDPDFGPETAIRLGVRRPRGALVKKVTPNSPAAQGHLQHDDLIQRFNGVEIEDDDHLVNQVGLTPIGQEVAVVLLREGKQYQTTLTVTARP
ncbi:S1C family serine protease [Rosistilla carotiformis]|nr:trypsin-like peptidase domain-containing protein [Rosistilla carotiformis]